MWQTCLDIVTRRYAHLSPAHLSPAVKKLGLSNGDLSARGYDIPHKCLCIPKHPVFLPSLNRKLDSDLCTVWASCSDSNMVARDGHIFVGVKFYRLPLIVISNLNRDRIVGIISNDRDRISLMILSRHLLCVLLGDGL